MGTSSSSKGPGTGTSLVPSWVEPINEPSLDGVLNNEYIPETDKPVNADIPTVEIPKLAPPRRFAGSRRSIGSYAKDGSMSKLNTSLSNYVKKGYGGSANITRRMATTARAAGKLYNVLDTISDRQAFSKEYSIDPSFLEGLSSDYVKDLIINIVSPYDGTQDTEINRKSIGDAFSKLFEINPIADLTTLTKDQISFVMVSFIGFCISNRINMDIGKSILDHAPNPLTAVKRINEMCEYIRGRAQYCYEILINSGKQINKTNSAIMANNILMDTYMVFEEYLK